MITIAAIAVSVFTLLCVEHLRHTAKQSFNSTVSGVDLIVGPRTGDINLLLTTVFRIGHPSQNMSWSAYQNLVTHPKVSWAIPISLGDSHRGFRVVGSEHQFFTHFQYGQSQGLTFSEGGAFSKVYDVVLGSSVARELGYTKGQTLVLAHGLGKTSFQTHDAFPFTVSGILKPTGTPVDNALYVSLAGLEAIHQPQAALSEPDHSEAGHAEQAESTHPSHSSVSAVMLGLTSKFATFNVQRELNTATEEPLTAILPGVALSQLWQMSRAAESALALTARLILFASLLGLSAVLIATLRERTYEFSVLRTLGAGPAIIFVLIQVEALFISALGIVLGGLAFLFAIMLSSEGLAIDYGIDIGANQISQAHAFVVLYVLVGAITVSMLPALAGYFRARGQ